ncbi:glutamate-5-semialdehyde dehydrogenase [Labrys sp. (in: a-proteobacteria)]|uniref:glutamate-5-semialdehyde dehydrogenase n=1 Tax=Labrys sp. (in: a-proteobacteria) TaxID=1917972 RepID=UPI0039E56A10
MPDENRGMEDGNVIAVMRKVGQAARSAARILALAPAPAKNAALEAMAKAILASEAAILAANAQDVADALARGQIASYVDRLTLDEKRVAGIAQAIREVAAQPDPVGRVLASWTRPNGLEFERVSTPLGVVGVIFESRPNVLADAGALCLKAGNAAILRGGSESFRTCSEIAKALRAGLQAAGLPEAAIQMVPTPDRSAVGAMLAGLDGNLDVLVPRGGKNLVSRVQAEARVPVFAHLEGVNHTYVHAGAALDMAVAVVLNAKMRRTGVCGATETLLVDQAVAPVFLKPLVKALLEAGCEVRGDSRTLSVDPHVKPADDTDWATEYLDAIISVKVVSGLDAALAHIERYGSHHTDAIVTDDEAAAARFLAEVDSAIVLHNASTQFADGGEFGFGGEIGIATGRMHARGPVGAEQLCSFKYRVKGQGTVRP